MSLWYNIDTMPELPEVETIKRGLNKFCVQKKINRVEVRCEKSFIGPKELVEGAKIIGLRRFGKALVFDLDNSVSMMVHLRMTGQLIFRPAPATSAMKESSGFAGGHPSDSFFEPLPNKQTRVLFEMSEGTLFFNDQRKFGFVKVIPTVEVEEDKFIKSLAEEPWKIEAETFYNKLQRRKNSPIKAVILDQKVICGLGNIYADEALYDAKIHPETLAGRLTKAQAAQLIKSACKVMDASIDSGGSTMATYVRADGTKGDYLEKFAKVFRREGQMCERCGAEIEKIRVAGRGTHICPLCQKTTLMQSVEKCSVGGQEKTGAVE